MTLDTSASSGAADSAPGWTGAVGAPTRLVLLRHGQTPMSIQRLYSGSASNPALTDLGHAQAQVAAEQIAAQAGGKPWNFAGIVASPQLRAQETAQYVAQHLGLDVDTDEDLRETNFGEWEGLTFSQARAKTPDEHMTWLQDPTVPPPGGEAFAEVDARVAEARARITQRYGATDVLVVSHVTPIKALLRQGLAAGFELYMRLHLDLASISVAEFYADGPTSVTLINETAHLR
ncbi:histidine phosphatase family protein [Corynebacterium sp. H113]|uniref:histidine phosphatase family protein n=1 Tax=Corynebacterium sp. H113 TaxID=3133419 RepID=UPI003098E654